VGREGRETYVYAMHFAVGKCIFGQSRKGWYDGGMLTGLDIRVRKDAIEGEMSAGSKGME
jgi:hypothetical protein